MKKYFNTRKVVAAAMLIALTVVLENYVSFKVLTYQIGFYFIPISISAMLFGPIYTALIYGIADLLGYLLNPMGAYIPLLTVTSVIIGLIYGFIYYRKTIPATLSAAGLRVLLAVSIVATGITLTANCFILAHAYGSFYIAMVPGRFIQTAIMLPLQVVVMPLVWIKLIPPLASWSDKKPVRDEPPRLSDKEAARPMFFAAVGLIMAGLSLACCLFPFFSFAGVVLGVLAVRLCDKLSANTGSAKKLASGASSLPSDTPSANAGHVKGLSVTGLSIAWVGLIVSTLSSMLYILFFFAAERLVTKFPFLEVFRTWFDGILSIF